MKSQIKPPIPERENFGGPLRKRKGNNILRIFGDTNTRYFFIQYNTEIFGYKKKSSDKTNKKTHKFSELNSVDFLKDKSSKSSTKEWKFGIEIGLSKKKYFLYAQNEEIQNRWVKEFKIILRLLPEAFPLIPNKVFLFAIERFEKTYIENFDKENRKVLLGKVEEEKKDKEEKNLDFKILLTDKEKNDNENNENVLKKKDKDNNEKSANVTNEIKVDNSLNNINSINNSKNNENSISSGNGNNNNKDFVYNKQIKFELNEKIIKNQSGKKSLLSNDYKKNTDKLEINYISNENENLIGEYNNQNIDFNINKNHKNENNKNNESINFEDSPNNSIIHLTSNKELSNQNESENIAKNSKYFKKKLNLSEQTNENVKKIKLIGIEIKEKKKFKEKKIENIYLTNILQEKNLKINENFYFDKNFVHKKPFNSSFEYEEIFLGKKKIGIYLETLNDLEYETIYEKKNNSFNNKEEDFSELNSSNLSNEISNILPVDNFNEKLKFNFEENLIDNDNDNHNKNNSSKILTNEKVNKNKITKELKNSLSEFNNNNTNNLNDFNFNFHENDKSNEIHINDYYCNYNNNSANKKDSNLNLKNIPINNHNKNEYDNNILQSKTLNFSIIKNDVTYSPQKTQEIYDNENSVIKNNNKRLSRRSKRSNSFIAIKENSNIEREGLFDLLEENKIEFDIQIREKKINSKINKNRNSLVKHFNFKDKLNNSFSKNMIIDMENNIEEKSNKNINKNFNKEIKKITNSLIIPKINFDAENEKNKNFNFVSINKYTGKPKFNPSFINYNNEISESKEKILIDLNNPSKENYEVNKKNNLKGNFDIQTFGDKNNVVTYNRKNSNGSFEDLQNDLNINKGKTKSESFNKLDKDEGLVFDDDFSLGGKKIIAKKSINY